MKRIRLLTSLFAIVAGGAVADDAALVFGNASYDHLGNVSRGSEPVSASEALRIMGFDVVSVADARSGQMGSAIAEFLPTISDAERIVVVLSGRFVTDGRETWFLASNAREPSYLRLGAPALPVDGILNVMSALPGGAILILATDPRDTGAIDAYLTEGIGPLDIPQGVTVLRGTPRDVADFIEDDLVEPEANLTRAIATNRDISATGFLPGDFRFMGPRPGPGDTRPEDPDAETALWQGATALDTVEAYQDYLARFPAGPNAEEARARIAEYLAEPNRAARLAEEALALDADARREIQRDLTILDYDTRGIDGIFGPGTRGAITNWQQENGFPQSSYLTAEQINRLDAQAARRAAELEAEAERQRQAELRRDRAFWEETGAAGDEPGLRAYLERYPDGFYSDTAKEQLAAIEEEKRLAAEAEDRAAWDTARGLDTKEGYETYLATFPNGVFEAEARAQIAEIEEEARNSGALQAARDAEAALNMNPITRTLVEAKLDQLGLEPGPVDGRFTAPTRRAIRTYQRDRDLNATGFLDEATLIRLLADTIGGRN